MRSRELYLLVACHRVGHHLEGAHYFLQARWQVLHGLSRCRYVALRLSNRSGFVREYRVEVSCVD